MYPNPPIKRQKRLILGLGKIRWHLTYFTFYQSIEKIQMKITNKHEEKV